MFLEFFVQKESNYSYLIDFKLKKWFFELKILFDY